MAKSGFNPGQGVPPPPSGGGSGGHKKSKPKTPRQVAQRSIAISQAKEAITHAEFNRRWSEYNDIYMDYAGRRATQKEARALIQNAVSFTALAKFLATKPAFYHSPIWKAKADGYLGIARDMGVKVRKGFIGNAIVNSWDQGVFQEKLRSLPQYLSSNEFKTTTAGLENKFRSLYGEPDAEWKNYIKRAAIARWTPDQWDSYLRAQPFYKHSTEYRTNLSTFQGLLGFAPTYDPSGAGTPGKPPPKDKRVNGNY